MIYIQVTKQAVDGYKITKLKNAVVIDAPEIGPRVTTNRKFRVGNTAAEADVQYWIGCPDTEVTVLAS